MSARNGRRKTDNIPQHVIRPKNFKRISVSRARYQGSNLNGGKLIKIIRIFLLQNNSKIFRWTLNVKFINDYSCMWLVCLSFSISFSSIFVYKSTNVCFTGKKCSILSGQLKTNMQVHTNK